MKRAGTKHSMTNDIDGLAADWIARRNGGLTPTENLELETWLAADPRHAAAFQEYDTAWSALNLPRRTGESGVVLHELGTRRQRRSRTRKTAAFAAISLAAAAAWVFTLVPPAESLPAPIPATAVLRPDRQILPDGSIVELNAGAELKVAFTPDKRGVALLKGEALFTVVKSGIPFVVSAGSVEVRAVGTAFSVRHESKEVGVLVTSGRVAVQRVVAPAAPAALGTMPASAPTYLNAGAKVVVAFDAPATAALQVKNQSTAELAAALAWRGNRVEFTNTPLFEAIEVFNRQNRIQLSIPDSALRERCITGIFWADDPEGFVRLLESGLDVQTERVNNSLTLRQR